MPSTQRAAPDRSQVDVGRSDVGDAEIDAGSDRRERRALGRRGPHVGQRQQRLAVGASTARGRRARGDRHRLRPGRASAADAARRSAGSVAISIAGGGARSAAVAGTPRSSAADAPRAAGPCGRRSRSPAAAAGSSPRRRRSTSTAWACRPSRAERPPAPIFRLSLAVGERVARGVERRGVLGRACGHHACVAERRARVRSSGVFSFLDEVDDAREARRRHRVRSDGAGRPAVAVGRAGCERQLARPDAVGGGASRARASVKSVAPLALTCTTIIRLGGSARTWPHSRTDFGLALALDHERRGERREHRLGRAVVGRAGRSASPSSAWCRCRG